MSFLSIFQHSGYEGVNKFPLAICTLLEPPEVEMAFRLNGAKDRLWEITEIVDYKPIKLKPLIFEHIYVCGVAEIELPKGFDYRDYANLDIGENMSSIPIEQDILPNTVWSVEFWKNGEITDEDTPLILGAVLSTP